MLVDLILSTEFLIFFLTCLLLYYVYDVSKRPKGLPPGPPCVPFIRNALWMFTKDPLVTFKELRKRYGDICCLLVGSRTVIILNGLGILKEAFIKNGDVFSYRPKSFMADEMSQNLGIIGLSGQKWKEQRTFSLSTLREFGFGKMCLENKISEEVENLIAKVKGTVGQPFNIHQMLSSSVGNVIASILVGEQFEYGNPVLQRIIHLSDDNSNLLGLAGLLNFYPSLKNLPGDLFKAKRIEKNLAEFREIMKTFVDKHKARGNCYKDAEDYIDAFLAEMTNRQSKTTSDDTFSETQLLFMLTELFGAGFETTVTALRWGILFLIQHPRVQEKMRQEIRHVCGNQIPCLDQRAKLKYCEATINEILRRGDIAGIILPHGVSNATVLGGYKIPAGAMIIPNGNSVHFDSTLFPDPMNFMPERFIDADGQLKDLDKIVPFSLGRRTCLGQALARMELLLYLTRLVQMFNLIPDKDDRQYSMEYVHGITVCPVEYEFRALEIL